MRRRLLLTAVLLTAATSALFHPPVAQAQVAVWPGTVVAPFVRVEWNGRFVHVCAPFVNLTVDLPRCCGCRPTCCETRAPHEASVQACRYIDSPPTRRQIAASAGNLFEALGQFETADTWRHYLEIAPGQLLSTQISAHSPQDASFNDALTNVLRHFDTANRQQQYQQITALPEFQHTHTLLANYLAQQSRGLTSNVKAVNVAAVGAADTAAVPAGLAVDTARTEVIAPAATRENAAQRTKSVQASVEELPSPLGKSGI